MKPTQLDARRNHAAGLAVVLGYATTLASHDAWRSLRKPLLLAGQPHQRQHLGHARGTL